LLCNYRYRPGGILQHDTYLMKVNAQYNIAAPGSLPIRIAAMQRRKMFEAFLALGLGATDTVLDIGATGDRTYDHSNYLEAWYPHKARITALGIDGDAAFLGTAYPGICYVQGDGRALPFGDRSFDYVHSAAVLEHVGSAQQQMTLIAEACRVARKGVFITTPNRWYPIEVHTLLPLVHWFPAWAFRGVLHAMGNRFLAREENLNLLSASQLRVIARRVGLAEECRIHGVRLLGVVSNLLFIVRKPCSATADP
jgi:ubiquinone/menaquinone biosynthesis C-methylase UbiE